MKEIELNVHKGLNISFKSESLIALINSEEAEFVIYRMIFLRHETLTSVSKSFNGNY